MSKGRMEAFCDGVIAIIITIMVLELRVPVGGDVKSLIPLAPIFLSYVLSFIFLAIYWNNYHHLLQAVKHVARRVLWANLHLLFWLSLIPFVTGCSKQSEPQKDQQHTISEAKSSADSSIIRDKNVDVASIDKNRDGKVYQCQMDYDVISDNSGTCPKCGMTLEEVTVKQAQENLKKSTM